MDGAFMKIYTVIHGQKRRNVNNFLENDHLPTHATWTTIKANAHAKGV